MIESGMRIGVAGLGKTGIAVARVAAEYGALVTAFDASEAALQAAREQVPAITPVLAQGWDEDAAATRYAQADLAVLVISPGIPPAAPLYAGARSAGVPVISEVELAWRLQCQLGRPRPWLAVTGTNGKTTTVGMTAQILRAAGMRAPAVGNVGTPLISVVAEGNYDALAVELSSFQLYSTTSMRAHAAACLNIAADHVDWHGSVEAYRAAKARIYRGVGAAAIYNVQDPATRRMVEQADVQDGARAIGFSLQVPGRGEIGLVEQTACDRAYHQRRATEALPLFDFADLAHLGGERPAATVVADALAAAALTRSLDVPAQAVREGLRDFHPAAHRRAVVGTQTGVTWIDDSKATNCHAAQASLAGMAPRSVVWIAGGDAKGQTFGELVAKVAPVLRGVVLIGRDQAPWLDALERNAPGVPVTAVPDQAQVMESAVNEAVALSVPGNSVVLAPACASWDQFPNYGERGRQFAEAVKGLVG